MVTWNANSIKLKLKELLNFISKNNYDIVGICETKIDDNVKIKIPGYKVYTVNRNNRGGGVAIIIRNNIGHAYFDHNIEIGKIEMVGVEIFSNSSSLFICQVYKPPNKVLNETDLKNLFCKKNMIIMGDMNCRRREWKCPTDNTSGAALLNFCITAGVTIAAPENFTNFPTVGRPSIIDFFLLKSNLNHSLPVVKCRLSSDHNPVEMCISYNFNILNMVKIFDYPKADWENFRRVLNESINLNFHIRTKEDVEDVTNKFVETISAAIHSCIPIRKENFQKDLLPTHIALLIKVKNKMRKRNQITPNQFNKTRYKKLEKLVSCCLRDFHRNKFKNFIKNLNVKDGSIWKFTKRFTKKFDYAPTIHDENGHVFKTDEEKAEAFAHHFSEISNNCNDLGTRTLTTKVNKTVKNFLKYPIGLDDICLTNFREVKDVIKSLKSNKATGNDLISAKILKNLPRKGVVLLIKIINGMFCTGHFPTAWKLAKVIPVPKPGKDPSKLTNQRPISLLSHPSKVAEKIIKKRMLTFLQKNKVLVDEQFGFRQGHSTVDQLARFVNQITLNFNKKLHTGAMLLDIEKAFDTVWHLGLIYKMILLNFPRYLINLIFSYLQNREMFVFLNGFKSLIRKLLAGVPQGSVLGPILFLIFINDAPKIKGVDDSIFADDKLMYTASYRISAIVKRLRQALKVNKRYYHKWKIKLNDSKTEIIIFTKRRPTLIDFEMDNRIIQWSDYVKYLGVLLDTKLTFTKHVNYLTSKAIATLIKLYPIFNRRSFFSPENKMLLYKVIVRSALTYACPVWSMMCKSNFDKLQVVQNKFLRLVGNYRRWSPIKLIHDELEIEYVSDYIMQETKKYYNNIENHTNQLIVNIKYDTSLKYRHKRIMNALK